MTKTEYIKAKNLIKNPRKWLQGNYTVDCFGMQCLPSSQDAIKWCALTACNKYAKDPYRAELKLAAVRLGFNNIFNLNETGTHADVMKMFDLAIGYCQSTLRICYE